MYGSTTQHDEAFVNQSFCGADQFDDIGQQRALIGRLISHLHSFVVDAHKHEPLPAAAPHDPSVAEESTNGDVPADNVNDEFL
jgi:hypothetical protein